MGDNNSEDRPRQSPVFSFTRPQQTGAIVLLAGLVALIVYRSC
ncbi:MAG TPA: hypothetical protein VJQ56_03205 [Blastocatellia bacterium]|nr:hypothetical protein [Blastocatellia bacterium]